MATSNTASVVANPLLEINTADLSAKKIGILAVNNPESYNQRELGFIDPTSIQLRIDINDNIVNLIEDPNYGNNYNLILPRNKNSLSEVYKKNGLTPAGVDKYLAKLPNLSVISADFLINTGIGGDFWEITWNYDGTFGKQTASYKGLKFARYSVNKAFTKWSFCDDSNMIGTLRLDYLNVTQGTNVMGWIKTPTTVALNKSQYPLLFDFIKTHWGKAASVNDGLGTLTVTNEAGLYPRFVGNQWTGAFQSNPDCARYTPSNNVDYANKLVLSSTGTTNNNWTGISGSTRVNFEGKVGDACGRLGSSEGVLFRSWEGKESVDTGNHKNNWLNRFTIAINVDRTFNTSIWDPSHNHTVNITTKNSSNNSNSETRVKSKFFSLLIYAGYPA